MNNNEAECQCAFRFYFFGKIDKIEKRKVESGGYDAKDFTCRYGCVFRISGTKGAP